MAEEGCALLLQFLQPTAQPVETCAEFAQVGRSFHCNAFIETTTAECVDCLFQLAKRPRDQGGEYCCQPERNDGHYSGLYAQQTLGSGGFTLDSGQLVRGPIAKQV